MRVIRFMSKKEFKKYKKGCTLYNDTQHVNVNLTDSIGFCFLNAEEYSPEYAYKFLIGAIFPEICCVFDAPEDKLKKGYGIYHIPKTRPSRPFKAIEYSTIKYSKEDFKLIRYTDCNMFEKYLTDEKFEWKKGEIL